MPPPGYVQQLGYDPVFDPRHSANPPQTDMEQIGGSRQRKVLTLYGMLMSNENAFDIFDQLLSNAHAANCSYDDAIMQY